MCVFYMTVTHPSSRILTGLRPEACVKSVQWCDGTLWPGSYKAHPDYTMSAFDSLKQVNHRPAGNMARQRSISLPFQGTKVTLTESFSKNITGRSIFLNDPPILH